MAEVASDLTTLHSNFRNFLGDPELTSSAAACPEFFRMRIRLQKRQRPRLVWQCRSPGLPSPRGVQWWSPGRETGGRGPPEAKAVWSHCLQILTAETIEIWTFHTNHLILDHYVSRWVAGAPSPHLALLLLLILLSILLEVYFTMYPYQNIQSHVLLEIWTNWWWLQKSRF